MGKCNIASIDQSFTASGLSAFNSKGELLDKKVIRTELDATVVTTQSVCSFENYWSAVDYIVAMTYDFMVKNKCDTLLIERTAFSASSASVKRLTYLFDRLVDFFSKRGYSVIEISSASHQSFMKKKSGLHVKGSKWTKAKQKKALQQCYPELYSSLEFGIKAGLTDLVDSVAMFLWYKEIGKYKEK